MYAVLIAGGKGERLRPLTVDRPKPMVEVAGRPIMARQIDWLIGQGVDRFVVSCGAMHEVIQDYFGNGSSLGVEITYEVEDTPMGRGGGLRLGCAQIPATEELFIATNADILSAQELAPMIAQHREDGNTATILLTPYVSQFGIVEIEGRQVRQFATNPVLPHWVNGGVYVMSREIEHQLPVVGDHEDSTFSDLAAQGKLGAFPSRAWWRAMDSVKDHARLEQELDERQSGSTGAG
ncbi:MAG: nucleotidyltransferase family protein [Chloroflexi bacterium]|nr:nucleotidyltransferase family protein [Chloroflexota bacterium]